MEIESEKFRCRLFCCYYAKLGNILEAALKAGFSQQTALAEGIRILSQSKYKKLVSKLSGEKMQSKELISTGLERLAFGSSNDAAFLVFSEENITPERIASLDLFNVSEIKKVKGGGVEVKFFDRQKAMEKIYDYASGDNAENAASNLIEALAGMDTEES